MNRCFVCDSFHVEPRLVNGKPLELTDYVIHCVRIQARRIAELEDILDSTKDSSADDYK